MKTSWHGVVIAITLFLALLLFLFASGTLPFFGLFAPRPVEKIHPIQKLLQDDVDFKNAWNLHEQGRYVEAVAAYDRAFAKAQSPEKRAQIKYLIASIHKITQSYELAVRGFKEIADNEQYPRLFRTFAVNEALLTAIDFGDFTHSHGDAHAEHAGKVLSPVAAELFNSEPYATFLAESDNDPALTARKVYEYASSLYPSAVSEMGQVQWYTNELYREKVAGTLSDDTIAQYIPIMQEKMRIAEKDLDRSIRSTYESVTISPALINRGFAYEVLWMLGEGSLEDADRSYRKAVELNDVAQAKGGVVYYAKMIYAAFLARAYGEVRSSEIQALLKDFTIENAEFPSDMKHVLKNMIKAPVSEGQKKGRRVIFAAAPEFKKFLLSLGIPESDLGGR